MKDYKNLDGRSFGNLPISDKLARILKEQNNPIVIKKIGRMYHQFSLDMYDAQRLITTYRKVILLIRDVYIKKIEDLNAPEPVKTHMNNLIRTIYKIKFNNRTFVNRNGDIYKGGKLLKKNLQIKK